MNLVIDIGNSFTKIAVFDNAEIIKVFSFKDLSLSEINNLTEKYPELSGVIISSVRNPDKKLLGFLKKNFKNFLELTENTPLPIENLYGSKKTLGKDRIALAVGANNIFPDRNVLVIDLGTAITYDLVNSKNQYIGGNISPGLGMRFKALNTFTDQLPLVKRCPEFPEIAKNTRDAVISGVQHGILHELDGNINRLKKKYDKLKIILTGGDAIFFDKIIKSDIFVDLNLRYTGLNRILEYNVRET